MPIVYRIRSLSISDSESDVENVAPSPSNFDDSIVLSDLVRTGEASRLRRRGAMRLDHGHPNHGTHQHSGSNSTIVTIRSTQNSDDEGVQQTGSVVGERRSNRPRSRRVAPVPDLDYSHILVCGVEETDFEEEEEYLSFFSSFKPSILPIQHPLSPSRLRSPLPRRKKSNGCGTTVHMSAAPFRRHGVWLAKDKPTSVVVQMEEGYFDSEVSLRLVTSPCGCVREGIGCAQCGNPLGVRYRFCDSPNAAMHHLRNKPSNHPVWTEGSRYGRMSSSNPANSFTYTFFEKSVSSTQPYNFLPRTGALETRSLVPIQETLVLRESDEHVGDGLQRTYNNTVFDRAITASPLPLSDVGEDDHTRSQNFEGTSNIPPSLPVTSPLPLSHNLSLATYDPDGEFLETEPNSPDKTNDVTAPLLPER